jgi:hypothetical protein
MSFRKILTALIVALAFGSLLVAVPSANAKPVSSSQLLGQPDPWLQSLDAQAKYRNAQPTDPWAVSLLLRRAYVASRETAGPLDTGSSSEDGLNWAAGVGAVLVVVAFGGATVVTTRSHRRPVAH